jgi:Family of unknown function (DUF6476)
MNKLAAGGAQSDRDEAASPQRAAVAAEADAMTMGMVARVRWLMIISGLTTLMAIAAVVSVIGYRVYHAGGSDAVAPAETIITLPKGARVTATTVADDRIVVTLDIAGLTEIRTFDLKTLRQTGRIRFATEP